MNTIVFFVSVCVVSLVCFSNEDRLCLQVAHSIVRLDLFFRPIMVMMMMSSMVMMCMFCSQLDGVRTEGLKHETGKPRNSTVKHGHANEVEGKADCPNRNDKDGSFDVYWFEKTLHGFDGDCETQREKRDAVHESTEDFGSLEPVRVFCRGSRF